MSMLMSSISIRVTAFEKAQILFSLTGILVDAESLFKSGFSSQEQKKQRQSWKARREKPIYLYPIMDLTAT